MHLSEQSDLNPKGHLIIMEFDNNSPFAALIPQFDTLVDQVKSIDAILAGLAGTHAARKAAVLATLTANEEALRSENPSAYDHVFAGPVHALEVATANLDKAKADHDDAREALNEAINEALRADKTANTTERDSHLATREALVTSAAAMATLIAGSPKPLTASDLGLGKPKGTGTSSGPRTAKVGQGVFSYQREGDSDLTTPCDAQQSLSSIAYRVFDKAPVGKLREAMAEANGGPVDETKPYVLTVTVNGKTASIHFDVTEVTATEG